MWLDPIYLLVYLQAEIPDSPWEWAFYGGALGMALLVIVLLATGQLRTKYELEAWQKQTIRSESQVDTLLPAMREQTQAMRELTSAVRELMEMMRLQQRGAT